MTDQCSDLPISRFMQFQCSQMGSGERDLTEVQYTGKRVSEPTSGIDCHQSGNIRLKSVHWGRIQMTDQCPDLPISRLMEIQCSQMGSGERDQTEVQSTGRRVSEPTSGFDCHQSGNIWLKSAHWGRIKMTDQCPDLPISRFMEIQCSYMESGERDQTEVQSSGRRVSEPTCCNDCQQSGIIRLKSVH